MQELKIELWIRTCICVNLNCLRIISAGTEDTTMDYDVYLCSCELLAYCAGIEDRTLDYDIYLYKSELSAY